MSLNKETKPNVFYFNILEQFLHVVCTIKDFSYMGQVGRFNENVFHSLFGLAYMTR